MPAVSFAIMKNRSVVLPLIGINILVFILQKTIGPGFTNAFLLHGGDLLVRPYTIITSMFLHGGFDHILFNMYVLFIFGTLLEQRIGQKRFLIIYFLSGILAGIGSQFLYDAALGASGAIMGMMGVVIMIMPNLRVLFFFFIPMPLWIAGIVIALIDTIGIFLPNSIANLAHLIGMGTGLTYGFLLKKQKKKFHRKFSKKMELDSDDVDEYLRSGRI